MTLPGSWVPGAAAFVARSKGRDPLVVEETEGKEFEIVVEICLNDINVVNGLNSEELHGLLVT